MCSLRLGGARGGGGVVECQMRGQSCAGRQGGTGMNPWWSLLCRTGRRMGSGCSRSGRAPPMTACGGAARSMASGSTGRSRWRTAEPPPPWAPRCALPHSPVRLLGRSLTHAIRHRGAAALLLTAPKQQQGSDAAMLTSWQGALAGLGGGVSRVAAGGGCAGHPVAQGQCVCHSGLAVEAAVPAEVGLRLFLPLLRAGLLAGEQPQ